MITSQDKKYNLIAAIATVVVTVAVILWMVFSFLGIGRLPEHWPPERNTDISMADELFVDVIVTPTLPDAGASAKAYDPIEETNLSEVSEESGTETVDQGPAGDPAPVVTSDRPAPVKVDKKNDVPKPGPAEDAKKKAEEEARRRARAATSGAFKGTGINNTTNPTGVNPGNSGSPSGTASRLNGRFNGRAGSGWGLPGYGLITSPVTGSVKVKVTIASDGSVPPGGVVFIGGDPPAATNRETQRNIEREIRSKRFTRANPDAPETATAYITITF